MKIGIISTGENARKIIQLIITGLNQCHRMLYQDPNPVNAIKTIGLIDEYGVFILDVPDTDQLSGAVKELRVRVKGEIPIFVWLASAEMAVRAMHLNVSFIDEKNIVGEITRLLDQ